MSVLIAHRNRAMTLSAHLSRTSTALGGHLTIISVHALFLFFGMALFAVFASLPFGFSAARQTAIVVHGLLHSELTLVPVVLGLIGMAILQVGQKETNLATLAAIAALFIGVAGYFVL